MSINNRIEVTKYLVIHIQCNQELKVLLYLRSCYTLAPMHACCVIYVDMCVQPCVYLYVRTYVYAGMTLGLSDYYGM